MLQTAALRYMDDPPDDGYSLDNYNQYTGQQGNHFSSGIQNKAFWLLATNSNVGRENAERIFYRALTQYLSYTAGFKDARCATIKSANDLFGVANRGLCKAGNPKATAVDNAWASVGVTFQTP